MVEHGVTTPPRREPPPAAAPEAVPRWARWVGTRRGAQVAIGLAVLVLVALALGVRLGAVALVGLALLCPLMMVAMMVGMGHGVHRMRGHHGHGGGDDRGAAGAVGGQGDRALGILRERYARGELSAEQYDRMRRDLG